MGSGGRSRDHHPTSPGPVFFPKPSRGALGDAPKHSFVGEYTNNPYVDPSHISDEMRESFSEKQLALLAEAAKTTEIPRRFQGAGMLMDYPGPGAALDASRPGAKGCCEFFSSLFFKPPHCSSLLDHPHPTQGSTGYTPSRASAPGHRLSMLRGSRRCLCRSPTLT